MKPDLAVGGLPTHAVERMRAVFASHPEIAQVILFGSRAKGNARRGSDIDLAIVGTATDSELGSIVWELDDLLLPWEIDLLEFNQLTNSDLRDHITRVGQVFYQRLEMAA